MKHGILNKRNYLVSRWKNRQDPFDQDDWDAYKQFMAEVGKDAPTTFSGALGRWHDF